MFDLLVKKVTETVDDHKTTILTGIGVAGTITTAVLSSRAGYHSAGIIQAEAIRRNVRNEHREEGEVWEDPRLTTKERIWMVGPQFVPAVGTGVLTIGAIIFANRLSAKETAAMAAMYSMSDKTFQEYKAKVQEKLGQNKETALRDEIAQNRVDNNPPDDRRVVITGNGDVLCYDVLTDRYFRSKVETIRRAENEINALILNEDVVSLSRFYEEIGLNVTPFSDSVGWNLENRCELEISTVMSTDQQPCISIDFKRWPKSDYDNIYHP